MATYNNPPYKRAGRTSLHRQTVAMRPHLRRGGVRPRMGLLKFKKVDEPLSDTERGMLDHELAIAEEIQANLLPKRIPQLTGYELGAYYKPSRDVGGDYYDFIEIDSDRLGLLVADVSGKGIPGSMVMTEARALIRSEATRTDSPAETFIRVNRILHNDIKRGMFVTAFYAILDTKKDTLCLTSAGHNPMVLWRKASNTCHLVNPSGLALGIDKGPIFERSIKEQKLQMYKCDRFVIYTDGVTEAMNEKDEPLGQNRFYMKVKEFAEKGSNEFISLMVKVVEEHQGKAEQHDDITIVTCRAKPQGGEE
ncbi:MAG: hypothetical protein A2W23_03855 [Planctomycetes bacterium RBG_16_43_13]|nr:MAG: hypothetical protein A2W23_03855 [Planctomycetes bacterium RBG_16_43_13]